jgi:hypothetical protein
MSGVREGPPRLRLTAKCAPWETEWALATVIPAQAGIQTDSERCRMPAFAGMTGHNDFWAPLQV